MNEQEKQARVTSLRLLAATPKSRKALQKKLEERGFPREVIEKTLDHLEGERLLDDRVLAQALFQNFSTHRISGRRRIAFELEKRGIRRSLVDELLERYRPEDERVQALELARLKRQRWLKLDRLKRRKKTYDFLIRRGFDFSLAREVMDEIERQGD